MLAAGGLHGDVPVFDGQDLQELARIPWQEWVVSVRFSPDGSRLLIAGGQRQPGGQRLVEVWRTSPNLFETTLGISRWLLGAALLWLVAVLPIARSLDRSGACASVAHAEMKENVISTLASTVP
jgi:hypothetical protein